MYGIPYLSDDVRVSKAMYLSIMDYSIIADPLAGEKQERLTTTLLQRHWRHV